MEQSIDRALHEVPMPQHLLQELRKCGATKQKVKNFVGHFVNPEFATLQLFRRGYLESKKIRLVGGKVYDDIGNARETCIVV